MRDSRYVLVAKASPAQVRWLRALARVHRTPLPPRLREKGGRTVAKITTNTDAGAVQAEIHRHVEIGLTLHTDEAGAYWDIGDISTIPSTIGKANSFVTVSPQTRSKVFLPFSSAG